MVGWLVGGRLVGGGCWWNEFSFLLLVCWFCLLPELVRKYATEVLDLISQSSTLMGATEEDGEEEEEGPANGTGNGKRSREEQQQHSKMQEGLNALPEFDPIRSIDALHPMEVDASGSLSPMQKRHKTFVQNHDRGKDMSLEEIYTFAGRWTVGVVGCCWWC